MNIINKQTNINKEIWVVMEILVQMSIRGILSGVVCVACDISMIGGQPYVAVCDGVGGD